MSRMLICSMFVLLSVCPVIGALYHLRISLHNKPIGIRIISHHYTSPPDCSCGGLLSVDGQRSDKRDMVNSVYDFIRCLG